MAWGKNIQKGARLVLIWLILCSCNWNPDIRVYQYSDIKLLYQVLIQVEGYDMYYFQPMYLVGDSNGNFKERWYLVILKEYK